MVGDRPRDQDNLRTGTANAVARFMSFVGFELGAHMRQTDGRTGMICIAAC